MNFQPRSNYDNPSTSYLNEDTFGKPDLDEEADYVYPPRRQSELYSKNARPFYRDAKEHDEEVDFSSSQQALSPLRVEKDSRSCFQRVNIFIYFPTSVVFTFFWQVSS